MHVYVLVFTFKLSCIYICHSNLDELVFSGKQCFIITHLRCYFVFLTYLALQCFTQDVVKAYLCHEYDNLQWVWLIIIQNFRQYLARVFTCIYFLLLMYLLVYTSSKNSCRYSCIVYTRAMSEASWMSLK